MSAPTPRGGAASGSGAPSFDFGFALASLPTAALCAVLLQLPLDDRLRCAEVCRSWRAMLDERSLWMRLDVASASRPCDALLRAAARQALRNVRSLDVSGALRPGGHVSVEALCAVAAQNPGLRIVRALGGGGELDMGQLQRLVHAVPRLAELHADVAVSAEEALGLVRSATPLSQVLLPGHLRLTFPEAEALPPLPLFHGLGWQAHGFAAGRFFNPQPAIPPPAPVPAGAPPLTHLLRVALPAHPARCTGLCMPRDDNDFASLSASVDAAVAAKLTSLAWPYGAGNGGALLLTRLLLENPALTELQMEGLRLDWDPTMPPSPSNANLVELCNALRLCRLTTLTLRDVPGNWRHRASYTANRVFCALANALAGHPTLQRLSLCVPLWPTSRSLSRHLPHAGVDAALASLLTAPALTSLDLSGCCFCDEELAPFVAAIAAGAAPRLRALDLRGADMLTDAQLRFVREVIAPAAEAAARQHSLSELKLYRVPPEQPPGAVYVDDASARGVERAVAAVAAVRGQRYIFSAEHVELCRKLDCDAESQAPLVRALLATTDMARCVLGGPFASAIAAGRLSAEDAAGVLRALVAHPSLAALTLEGNLQCAAEVLGDVLGHIVAADAPLESLRCAGCSLGDAGLAPLFEALPRNTRLRRLECTSNKLTSAFTREVLLPSVQDNTGLVHLSAAEVLHVTAAAVAAAALVNARGTRG